MPKYIVTCQKTNFYKAVVEAPDWATAHAMGIDGRDVDFEDIYDGRSLDSVQAVESLEPSVEVKEAKDA